jgi:hypothetical protein
MRDSRDAERYSNQADQVVTFCEPASLDGLEHGTNNELNQPVALLDDRKEDLYASRGENSLCRHQRGPLSPRQLFQELQKPV